MKPQELTRRAVEGICSDITSQAQADPTPAFETTLAEQIAELQTGLEAQKSARINAEERAAACSEALTKAEQKTSSYAATLEKALINWQTEARARAQAEQKVKACAKAIANAKETAASQLNSMHTLMAVVETADCECCGRKNLRKESSVKIDSGQLLCPDCLRELQQCQPSANGPSH